MVHYRKDMATREGGGLRGTAAGAPHDLVLALLLLSLTHHNTLDDRALLGREVREVRHVGHGVRRRAACGARARRVLRCYARGALLCAPLRPKVYLIMPDGPMARSRLLTSANLLISTRVARPPVRRRAGVKPPEPSQDRCVRIPSLPF